jgi:hypothetical protein
MNKILSVLALAFGLSAPGAFGAAVSIGNASFESPVLNAGGATWTNTLEGGWMTPGVAGDSFVEFIGGFAAEGVNHIGLQNAQTVYQDLATSFTPNTMYTLTVATGNRNASFTLAGNISTYQIADSAGIVFASGAYDAFPVPVGTFTDATPLTFMTPAAGGPTGPIRINLVNSGTGRSHFDNIRLDATVIPEPVTIGLLSLGTLLIFRRRRR